MEHAITHSRIVEQSEPAVPRADGEAVGQNWPSLPSSVVKSAGRVLQILEYFDDTRRAMNMVDVSRALGYPESSTSILLRSLVTLGYLEYDRFKRTYRPTNRVRLLGNWIDRDLFEGDAVIRLMERLNEETHDAVFLASRNGLDAQYIHVVQARTALRLHVTTGTTRSLCSAAVGYVLLSSLTDTDVANITRRVNAEMRDVDRVYKLAEVLCHVESVRKQGYVLVDSQITPGTAVLAMPLQPERTNSPLAIAIGGPAERMHSRRDELLGHLNRYIAEVMPA